MRWDEKASDARCRDIRRWTNQIEQRVTCQQGVPLHELTAQRWNGKKSKFFDVTITWFPYHLDWPLVPINSPTHTLTIPTHTSSSNNNSSSNSQSRITNSIKLQEWLVETTPRASVRLNRASTRMSPAKLRPPRASASNPKRVTASAPSWLPSSHSWLSARLSWKFSALVRKLLNNWVLCALTLSTCHHLSLVPYPPCSA